MLYKNRRFCLDFVRAIAITSVLIAHTTYIFRANIDIGIYLKFFGFMGVEIFFALSGYLIGFIILKTTKQGFFKKDLLIFLLRRWMRTLPAYWLILIVLIVIYGSIDKRLSFFVFMQEFLDPDQTEIFFGVAWSLVVEELFYILFGITLFIIMRSFQLGAMSAIGFLCLVIIITSPLVRYAYSIYFDDYSWWGMRKYSLLRFDAIAWGVLLSWINFYFKKIAWIINHNIRYIVAIIIVTSVGFLYILSNDLLILENRFFKSIGFSIFPMLFALLIFCIDQRNNDFIPNDLFQRSITLISVSSYSLYLIHWEVILFISNDRIVSQFGMPVVIVAYISILYAAVYILYTKVERPFIELRDLHFNIKYV